MTQHNVRNQKNDNQGEIRREILSQVYEILISLPDKEIAGSNADDANDRHCIEWVPQPHSKGIITDDRQRGGCIARTKNNTY